MTKNTIILRVVALLALAFSFAMSKASAGDKPVSFVATVTGMVCDGCKSHIRESFSKLEGVSSVEIAVGATPGTHAVTVTTTSDKLTKEQAVASLGSQAETYGVQTWERK